MSESKAQQPTALKKDALGLVEATVQSGADIAPAVAVVTSTVFIASLAGLASPLSFLLGTLIALALAKVVADYAKRMATAGSFYTFLTRSFGPKTGFTMGMLLFLAYVLLLLFQMAFFGEFVSGILPGLHIPWEVWAAAMILLNTGLTVSGVRPSLRVGLVGLAFESIVFLILAVLIVAHGGATGNSIRPFLPSEAPSTSGMLLGIIFGIFVFVGFETSTTLGEETRNPLRTIPIALYLTVGIIGLFVVFVTYSAVVGFGVSKAGLTALENDPVPYVTLAARYGNSLLRVLVDVATVTSFLALNLIMILAASRMVFSISRDGLLPRSLSRLNRHHTPAVASWVITGSSLVFVLITGIIWKPLTVAGWYAFLSTLFFIAAYATACVGVPVYYYQYLRSEFRWLGNIVIPGVALVGMGAVLYGNIHPFPPAPLNYFPFVTIFLIGLLAVIAWRLEQSDPEKVRLAGQLFVASAEQDELPPTSGPLKADDDGIEAATVVDEA